LKDNVNEIRSLNAFLAEFYIKHSSIKDFACRRVPYHYDQASMPKELITYLRSPGSRSVALLDRQVYLRVRFKKKMKLFDMIFLFLFRNIVVLHTLLLMRVYLVNLLIHVIYVLWSSN
jgi:hypothetical protein